MAKVFVTEIKYLGGYPEHAKVFLSNGDELMGLISVAATASENSVSEFKIEGFVHKAEE